LTWDITENAIDALSGHPWEVDYHRTASIGSMATEEREPLTPEQQFLRRCFIDHYVRSPPEAPYRFTRREWGFFPFGGKMMFRHISFTRKEELDAFFRQRAPMHAYHSSAYYSEPSLQPMGEKVKTWMGADLIFDLDADHIPNSEKLSYVEQLEKVKEEMDRLVRDFLISDLGFRKEGVELFFSGGRGYHAHIRDPSVLPMDSRDRRQLVDYITGNNLDFDVLFPDRTVEVNKRFGSSKKRRNFRNRGHGGWVTKIYKGKDSLLNEMLALPDNKSRVQKLLEISRTKKLGIGQQKCSSIVEDLFKKGGGVTVKRMLEEDMFQVTSTNTIDTDFLKFAASYSSINLSGETDEPVTTDTKRLIRCPGSLHGKTGFRVISVPLDRLPSFDPLRDAVALGRDPVEVSLNEGFSITMGGEDFDLKQGRVSVPKFLAYFLVARGKAKMLPDAFLL
jgi:DNA primase small subunit